jgi:hypothetical protein
MTNTIFLTKVRLSFPKLIEPVAPQTPPGAAAKYGADLIIRPDSPEYAKFMGEVASVATAKWKDMAMLILKNMEMDRKLRCWGNGSEKLKKETMRPYEGYEGMAYISGSQNEDRPPTMIDKDGNPCDPANTMLRKELARKLYGGCYVNAAVSLWAQDNQFGRAIRCNLLAVQFAEDGVPFGDAAPDMSGLFKPVDTPAAASASPSFPAMPWAQ